jgi:light-regulated signal transduction histidine kinase (bacteriophytochrome)
LASTNEDLRREIKERQRAESELARHAEELTRANSDLEQFAYSASHDFQEPIRNVTLFSQMLASDYRDKLDSQAGELIDVIVEGSKRMGKLVSDLLSYSRAGGGSIDNVEFVDANLVLAGVLENLRTAIAENHAIIDHDELPFVKIPFAHLQQLLQNLVLNAIKYHGPTAVRVHISAQTVGGYSRFSVRDNGIGIAPVYHEKIFGIFKRLHTREEYDGTGMGLAICKRVVERFGGRIWVESELGQGATFVFTLPTDQSSEES